MRGVAVGTSEPEDRDNFERWNDTTSLDEDRNSPYDKRKIPWWLPRRDPDIAGKIVQIQQSQELPEYPNLLISFKNLLVELIWRFIPHNTMRREEERWQITTVRVRTSDGEKRDARLIGFLRETTITLGDDVWFWGWHRKDCLIVRKGYNWTLDVVIK